MTLFLASCPTEPRRGHEDAHRLLAKLYRTVTGEEMPPLVYGDRGKPSFSQGPWHLSISHTRSMAVCALADQTIGLDAESLDRPVPPKLPPRVLSEGELARWCAGGSRPADFLTLWTLKEAAGKYTGQGLPHRPGTMNFMVQGDRAFLTGSDLFFRLTEHRGHVISICTADPLPEPLRWLDDL